MWSYPIVAEFVMSHQKFCWVVALAVTAAGGSAAFGQESVAAQKERFLLQANLKVAENALKAERESNAKKFKEFKDSLAAMQEKLDARDEQLATVRDELRKAQLAPGGPGRNAAIAKAELDRIRAERELLAEEKKQRLAEVVALRKEAEVQKQIAIEKEIHARMLEKKLDKLLTAYQSQTAELRKLQGGKEQPPKVEPKADLRGEVVGFADSGLTSISIGTENGVEVGMKLPVFRPNPAIPAASKYLGEILIRTVKPKDAVGQFYPAGKDKPQPGDHIGVLK